MLEADLILVLNEALARAGKGVDIQFSQVKYLLSGEVSALLTKKANARLLISQLSNVFIWASKTVDAAMIEVEILEYWQYLKVHGMSLNRYLDEKKMELLKRNIKLSTDI